MEMVRQRENLTSRRKRQRQSGEENKKKKTLMMMNPNDSVLQIWNKILLSIYLVALALDPLFLYTPFVEKESFCLTLDMDLAVTIFAIRGMIDCFTVVQIVFKLRTGFMIPGFGRGEVNKDEKDVANKYLRSHLITDFLSIVPLPQFFFLFVFRKMRGPGSLLARDIVKWLIFFQMFPRIARIYPVYKEVTRTSGFVAETAWAGAALNLCLYILASHFIGSAWYMISIERKYRCWHQACTQIPGCIHRLLYCSDSGGKDNRRFLKDSCPLIGPEETENSTAFNFGIFAEAAQSGIMESRKFSKKFCYSFWWGLRNLSALGQNLKTSSFEGEIIFAVVICISGLFMFALLVGNMQRYLLSTTVRVEEMRVKKRDAEKWMSHRRLPVDLRKRVRKYEQYKWQETKGVEEESILSSLPKDLRKDIKRHLCFDLLKKVHWLAAMEDSLLDVLCARLKRVLYTQRSYIVRVGEPVEEILFIMRGKISMTYGGTTGFFNPVSLEAGDLCGDPLLTWALDPQSSHLPISYRNVQAETEVEGFVLLADDLKFIASQYRPLHSKQLLHMFRYCSVQCRTWAALIIQGAWRRHWIRKLSNDLSEAEGRVHENDDHNTLQLGASRSASHAALRNLGENAAASSSTFP